LQVVPVAPGFRLWAQTPTKRLKFDSHPGHQSSSLKLNELFDHHYASTSHKMFFRS